MERVATALALRLCFVVVRGRRAGGGVGSAGVRRCRWGVRGSCRKRKKVEYARSTARETLILAIAKLFYVRHRVYYPNNILGVKQNVVLLFAQRSSREVVTPGC